MGIVTSYFEESIDVKRQLLSDEATIDAIEKLGSVLAESLRTGHKLVICGNGGSASDALHFAGEIVGRFKSEREPWPAVVLNADVATITAISNDYSYDEVFARQAKAHCSHGDVFIGISTSGNSNNVLKALNVAKEQGAVTGALLGKGGGTIADFADISIIVPSDDTARIQESHITIIHALCGIVEAEII